MLSARTPPFWVQLYRRFGRYLADKQWKLDPRRSYLEREAHQCTAECEVFEWADHFVCCHTGQVHHCTPEVCTLYVIARDGRLCLISRRTWALEPEDQMDMSAVLGQQNSGSVDRDGCLRLAEETAPPPEPDYFAPTPATKVYTNEELETIAYAILRKLCLSRERRALDIGNFRTSKKRITASFRQYVYYCSANHIKLELLTLVCLRLTAMKRQPARGYVQYVKGVPVPTFIRDPSPDHASCLLGKLRYYAQQCVVYWRQLSPVVLPGKKKVRYRFPFHCLAFLYTLRKGAGTAAHTLLPADPSLVSLLPEVPHLNELSYNLKVFTQHKEQFLKRLMLTHKATK